MNEAKANPLAKVDGNGNQRAGQWLLCWRNAGWVESSGVGQFQKTDKFGRL